MAYVFIQISLQISRLRKLVFNDARQAFNNVHFV